MSDALEVFSRESVTVEETYMTALAQPCHVHSGAPTACLLHAGPQSQLCADLGQL